VTLKGVVLDYLKQVHRQLLEEALSRAMSPAPQVRERERGVEVSNRAFGTKLGMGMAVGGARTSPGAPRAWPQSDHRDIQRQESVFFEKGVSMTQDAVNTFLEQRTEGVQRSIDVAKALVGDKPAMTVTFRQEPMPLVRGESPKRHHIFQEAAEFGAYLKRYGTENTVVLADGETGEAEATLDESRTDGFERVRFVPVKDAEWTPWDEMLGGTYDIREFAGFLGKHRSVIVDPNAAMVEHLYSQIRYSKSITTDCGRGAKAVNGVTVETTVGGQGAEGVVVTLPDQLKVKCAIFFGGTAGDIAIDVKLNSAGDVPTVTVLSSDAVVQQRKAIKAMLATIKGALAGAGTVAIGKLGYEPWGYSQGGPVTGAHGGIIVPMGR
jgi:hypothetical protein